MRPIDADGLKKLRDEYICGKIKFDDEYDLIDKCPTLDISLVMHGQWKPFGRKWACSECNARVCLDGTPEENNLYYCPNCGAKMDRGEKYGTAL